MSRIFELDFIKPIISAVNIMKNSAQLYLINSNIMLVEHEVVTRDHHHHAIKIAINLGVYSKIIFNDEEIDQNTIIVDADRIHSLDSNSNPVLVLLINPESEIGSTIRQKYLNEDDFFFLNYTYDPHLENHFKELLTSTLSRLMIQDIFNDIIHALCGKTLDAFTLDKRIEDVIYKIEALEDKKISVEELASQVFLSPGRFAHLFKEETNIPVRQYLAWLRLLDALKMIMGGLTFTDAAMESGFTDLPHLHKTFTHFFGVSLSEYFKHSRFIQAVEHSSS